MKFRWFSSKEDLVFIFISMGCLAVVIKMDLNLFSLSVLKC